MKRRIPSPDEDRDGLGQSEEKSDDVSRSVDDLLKQDALLQLLLIICQAVYRRLNFGWYDPTYSNEDFYQDVSVKLLKSPDSFQPSNIPNEKALMNLLYTMALHRGFSKLREIKRQRPWLFTRITVEDLPEKDSGFNLFREWAARQLMGFTEELPDERRRALELRLEGYSFREIAQLLEREGVKVSHVSAQRWVEASLQFLIAKAS